MRRALSVAAVAGLASMLGTVAIAFLASIPARAVAAGENPITKIRPPRPRGYGDRVVDVAMALNRFDFARDIGLVEGERKDSLWVLIADSTLAIGDSLTLISDEPNPDSSTYVTLISAAVKERLHRVPSAKMVPEPGDVFYRLAAPRGALDCCIFGYAVRAPRGSIRAVAGRAEADLDRDGTPEIFQSCGSGDLLYPAVWSGRALTGALRWKRGYHLDYPVDSNCPGSHDIPAQ